MATDGYYDGSYTSVGGGNYSGDNTDNTGLTDYRGSIDTGYPSQDVSALDTSTFGTPYTPSSDVSASQTSPSGPIYANTGTEGGQIGYLPYRPGGGGLASLLSGSGGYPGGGLANLAAQAGFGGAGMGSLADTLGMGGAGFGGGPGGAGTTGIPGIGGVGTPIAGAGGTPGDPQSAMGTLNDPTFLAQQQAQANQAAFGPADPATTAPGGQQSGTPDNSSGWMNQLGSLLGITPAAAAEAPQQAQNTLTPEDVKSAPFLGPWTGTDTGTGKQLGAPYTPESSGARVEQGTWASNDPEAGGEAAPMGGAPPPTAPGTGAGWFSTAGNQLGGEAAPMGGAPPPQGEAPPSGAGWFAQDPQAGGEAAPAGGEIPPWNWFSRPENFATQFEAAPPGQAVPADRVSAADQLAFSGQTAETPGDMGLRDRLRADLAPANTFPSGGFPTDFTDRWANVPPGQAVPADRVSAADQLAFSGQTAETPGDADLASRLDASLAPGQTFSSQGFPPDFADRWANVPPGQAVPADRVSAADQLALSGQTSSSPQLGGAGDLPDITPNVPLPRSDPRPADSSVPLPRAAPTRVADTSTDTSTTQEAATAPSTTAPTATPPTTPEQAPGAAALDQQQAAFDRNSGVIDRQRNYRNPLHNTIAQALGGGSIGNMVASLLLQLGVPAALVMAGRGRGGGAFPMVGGNAAMRGAIAPQFARNVLPGPGIMGLAPPLAVGQVLDAQGRPTAPGGGQPGQPIPGGGAVPVPEARQTGDFPATPYRAPPSSGVPGIPPMPIGIAQQTPQFGGGPGGANTGAESFIQQRGGHSAGTGAPALDPVFASRVQAAAQAYERETGQRATFSETGRSRAQQAIYYDRFRRGQGGLAAAPGSSRHERGMAVDIPDGAFQNWMHRNASKFGLEGLQDPRDPNHFQMASTAPGRDSPLLANIRQRQAAAAQGL